MVFAIAAALASALGEPYDQRTRPARHGHHRRAVVLLRVHRLQQRHHHVRADSGREPEDVYVLDVRDASQFAKEHIPGAVNVEWRKVFAGRATLPKDKTNLAYYNTGSFSAQSAMALRMAGFENVRILHSNRARTQDTQSARPARGTRRTSTRSPCTSISTRCTVHGAASPRICRYRSALSIASPPSARRRTAYQRPHLKV